MLNQTLTFTGNSIFCKILVLIYVCIIIAKVDRHRDVCYNMYVGLTVISGFKSPL